MIENEVKILNIDIEKWISFLEQVGAEKKGEWLQRRKVYDFKPVCSNKWLRLRTNGIETTLTIKEVVDKKRLDGTREVEIIVSDFDKTDEILKELGYDFRSYQENKRIRYIYQGVEFDIDTWPLIPTYVEIEGKTKEDVEKMLETLPLDCSAVTTLDVNSIYLDIYGINNDFKILTFQEQSK